jgi:trigger factor
VVRGATVKDTAGNTIDTAEFFGPRQEAAGADSDAAVAAEEEAKEEAEEEADESDEDNSQ